MDRTLAGRCATILLSGVVAGCASSNSTTAPTADADELANVSAASRAITLTVANSVAGLDLGTLGGSASYATAISAAGVVVGYSNTSTGAIHAFRWTRRTGMQDLGTLPGDVASQAVAVLGSGEILGWSQASSASPFLPAATTPVIWGTAGRIRVLAIPPVRPGAIMYPSDFNERGEIVGYGYFNDGGNSAAWYWAPGLGTIDLSTSAPGYEGAAAAINSRGVVLGSRYSVGGSFDRRSYLWVAPGTVFELGVPANLASGSAVTTGNVSGYALNDAGTVAGGYEAQALGSVPFLWRRRQGFTQLTDGSGAAVGGYAFGLNDLGIAVGLVRFSGGTSAAVAWLPLGNVVALQDGGVATSVNLLGDVAGWGVTRNQLNHAMLWRLRDGISLSVERSLSGAAPADDASGAAKAAAARACLFDDKALGFKARLDECIRRNM